MKFRVGVIGATGFIGTPYRAQIRDAKDDADIVALCARRRGPLEEAAREDRAGFVTGDWREIVEHPDVDLVMVVTPGRAPPRGRDGVRGQGQAPDLRQAHRRKRRRGLRHVVGLPRLRPGATSSRSGPAIWRCSPVPRR